MRMSDARSAPRRSTEDRIEEDEAGDGRQRHGRGANARGAAARSPPTCTTSPCSAPSRTRTTTGSCCRRCSPASRRSPTSSSTRSSGTPSTASPCTSARRSSTSTAAARIVVADDGTEAPYDRLLVATGSNPFILPLPGKDLAGVISYRDIADTNAMIETAKTHKHAVVIGGGLLGLEAANGLMLRGMSVTVVHIDALADGAPARRGRRQHAAEVARGRGLKFLIGAQTAALLGDGPSGPRREGACGASRTAARSRADLVVMAAGIRPNTALAEKIGLHCNRGIVVNDTMQTITDGRIYAVGECAAHRGIAYGLVAPLFEQAKVCATHLGRVRHRPLPRLADLDQAQGHRHRPVLGGRLRRRRRQRGDRPQRPVQQRLQEARRQGRQADRRLPLRRHRRRLVVLRHDPRGQEHRRRSATS